MSIEPDFENTQIAFKMKSDAELWNAYLLFKSIQSNTLVKIGPKLIDFALKIKLPVQTILRSTIFKHFCGGETIQGCIPTIEKLAQFNVGTILDYSVEAATDESGFQSTFEEIKKTILFANGNKQRHPFCVFKVTGLGPFTVLEKVSLNQKLNKQESIQWERMQGRIADICQLASDKNQKIFFDAEESWIQNAIDSICKKMMEKFNQKEAIVFNTVQMYRVDRLEYTRELIAAARKSQEVRPFFVGLKVVRGAYMEKERARAKKHGLSSPIYPSKEETDRAFNACIELLLESLDYATLCAGTHNQNSIEKMIDAIKQKKLKADHPSIYFSQLYGMSDNLTFNLSVHGYHASKYLPYGPVEAALPYLFRRAQENTSVEGQSSRELQLIRKEIKNRNQLPIQIKS